MSGSCLFLALGPEPMGRGPVCSHLPSPSHSRETTMKEIQAVLGVPACPAPQDCPARGEKR